MLKNSLLLRRNRLCGHQGYHPGPFFFRFHSLGSLQPLCFALLYLWIGGRARVGLLFAPPYPLITLSLCLQKLPTMNCTNWAPLPSDFCWVLQMEVMGRRSESGRSEVLGHLFPRWPGCGLAVTVLCYLRPDLCCVCLSTALSMFP